MAGGSLGTIRGQIRLDVASAIAGYAAVRAANAHTINTMNDARQRMKGFGLAAVGMGAAFLTGFGMAVNAAADFEKKLDYFGAVNNATAGEMEKVRAKALELGKTSVYSASQIADAFVELGKAGVSAQDITDGMADAMVNLAQAADIDLSQATNIVTSQIQAYGLAAKDATHVTDLMAGAANASIIDVQDIGVSMKYVAGVAHSLSISIDSTTDAISLLGKAGIKGSTAGTSLRQIMVSLAGGTQKARGELQELGIITKDGANKFFTAEGKAKSLAQIFQILQDATANLTEKERLMAFRTIFNNRALAAAQILTKEGAAGFAEMNAEISKTTAADVAAKRMDNLAGDIRKLKGTFETLMIEAGTPFQNFLRQIVQGLTSIIAAFARLPQGVQTSIFAFMAVAGVVLTVAGTIAIMGAAFTGAMGALRSVMGAFKLLGNLLLVAARATWALTIAALSNPYVLIALAVIALVAALVLLYKKSETVRNFLNMLGAGIKTAFLATVEWFKGLPAFFSGVWDSITGFFKSGVDWVVAKWNSMINFFTEAPGKIKAAAIGLAVQVITFVQSVPGQVAGFLSSAWDSFLSFMSDLPGKIGYALGFALGTLVKWHIQVGQWARDTGSSIVNTVVTFFSELPGKIGTFLSQTWEDFKTWSTNFILTALIFANNTIVGITQWFEKLPGRIWDFLVSMKDKAVKNFKDTVAAAKKFGSDVITAIVTFFKELPGKVSSWVGNMVDSIQRKFRFAVDVAKLAGKNMLKGVIDNVKSMPGKVWDIVGRVVGSFKDMVKGAFNAAKDFAAGLWNGFKDGLGIHSPSYIEHAMWAITGVAGEETKRLKGQVRTMQGLAGSLQEVKDTVGTKLSPEDVAAYKANVNATAARLTSIFPEDARLLQLLRIRSMQDGPATASKKAAGSSSGERPINITVNNPIAERTSETTARKLRTLSAMGAF